MTHYIDTRKLISDIQMRPALWNRNYAVNKAFTEDTWDELSEIHSLPKSVLKTRWKSLRDNFRIEFKRIPRDAAGNCLISPGLHKSKWAYYKALLFLVDHMKSRYPINDYAVETNVGQEFVRELQSITPESTSNLEYVAGDESDEIEYIQIPDVPPPLNNVSSLSPEPDHVNGQESLPLPPLVPVSAPKNYQAAKRQRTNDEDGNTTSNGQTTSEEKDDDDYHFLMSLHTFMGQLKNGQKLKVRMKIQDMLYKELFNDEEDSDENGVRTDSN